MNEVFFVCFAASIAPLAAMIIFLAWPERRKPKSAVLDASGVIIGINSSHYAGSSDSSAVDGGCDSSSAGGNCSP